MKFILSVAVFIIAAAGCIQADDSDGFHELVKECGDGHMVYKDIEICPNITGVLNCYEDVKQKYPDMVLIVDFYSKYYQTQMNNCPGLVEKNTCVWKESQLCTKQMNANYGTNNSCSLADEAEGCLLKLMDMCDDDRFIDTIMKEVKSVKAKCDSGIYGKGQCSENTIWDCNMDVYIHYTHKGGKKVHDCVQTEVTAAEKCLNDLSKKCTSKDHKRLLQKERQWLKEHCPA